MTHRMRALSVAFVLTACSKSEAPPQAQPAASAPPPATAAAPTGKRKDPELARTLIGSGATLIDVRTPDEFADGHLPAATNIPVDELQTRIAVVDSLVGHDKSKAIVVYCASGSRSAAAKKQLEAAGYTQVVNGGGLDDLQ